MIQHIPAKSDFWPKVGGILLGVITAAAILAVCAGLVFAMLVLDVWLRIQITEWLK